MMLLSVQLTAVHRNNSMLPTLEGKPCICDADGCAAAD
jgi:hypothetical protein